MRKRKYSSWRNGCMMSFAPFYFPSASSSLSSSLSPSSTSFLFVSSFSAAAIVVAFDVAVLSNALESFVTKGGGKNSFDLFICMPYSAVEAKLAEGNLEDVLILNRILEYRAVLHANCSEIQPQLPTDYNQILYLIMPDNKSVIENSLLQISQFYHMTKRTFYESSPVGKLLWMPLFLVVWPDLADYCKNDTTTEKLIRAFFPQPHHSLNNKNKNNNAADEINGKEGKDNDKGVFLLLSQQSFSVNSDVYFYFGKECEKKRDNVWEVYSLQQAVSGTAEAQEAAMTSTEIIIQKLTPDRIPYESMFEGILGRVRRRMDLRETLINAVASRDPSSFLMDPSPGEFNPLDIINGTPHMVFKEMSQGLNFTSHIVLGDWIRRHPNGTLRGTTAGLFRSGLADVTISLTSLLPYRKVELSFLQPTYLDSVNGFFVQPAASSFRDIVIAPFSFGLWLSLLITYLIIVTSVLCFGEVYRKMYAVKVRTTLLCEHSSELPENDSAFRNELLLWAVGAVTQQGWHVCPHSNAIRVAFMLGYVLGLVCYGAFSAAVVSILAVELIPIKTRADLFNSSLTFYADDASSTMAYIVNYLRNNTQVSFGNPVNIQQGVEKLQRSKQDLSCYLAFPQYFYLSATAINISQSWICDSLSVIQVTTSATPNAMVVPRNSEYAELFNFMIMKMIGRGLNRRYVQLYNEKVTLKCTKESGQVFHPLGYSDMFTAFLIVFTGGMSAVALLIGEKILFFLVKRRGSIFCGTNKSSSSVGIDTTSTTETATENNQVRYGGNWLY